MSRVLFIACLVVVLALTPAWGQSQRLGKLVLTSVQGKDLRVVLTRTDGSGATELAKGSDPSFSADGRTVLFAHNKDDQGALCTVSATGGPVTVIRRMGGTILGPVFSPDGRQIAFAVIARPSEPPHVCVVNADGSGMRTVVGDGGAHSPRWSADGKTLAFVYARDAKHSGIGVAPASGGKVRMLVDDDAVFSLAWSPDGRRIAYVKVESDASGVYVIQADGTARKQATRLAGTRVGLAWGDDGATIFSTVVDPGASTSGIVMIARDMQETRMFTSPRRTPYYLDGGYFMLIMRAVENIKTD